MVFAPAAEARMTSRLLLLVAALSAALGALGCERRSETPPEVASAYSKLQDGLDLQSPGASVGRLLEFRRRNARYAIVSTIDEELKAWRPRLDAAYRQARDLAREEQYDRAEAVLKDLAQAQDERAGRLAREFLAFEFPFAKARRLLQKGDAAGAEAVARTLRQTPLTDEQLTTIERLLDDTKTVDIGITMTRTTALKSAARMLQVFLHSTYAEDGQYPSSLALDSPALASLRQSGPFLEVVGAIEGYMATPDEFSFVVVGKDPRQRMRVTQSTIEDIPPPGRP